MNISPINCNTQYPTYKGKSRDLERVLDAVSKNSTISVEDKFLIIEKIKNALHDIIKPSRFMGEGSHKAVFKITKKYAARVPVNEHLTENNIGDTFIFGKNQFKNLSNYFGEPVVTFGKFQILRNIENQFPAGVPEHLAKNFSKNKIRKYYIEKYLPRFAQIAQASYNKLAMNLATLNSMKFGPRSYGLFDAMNPNNVVTSKGNLYLVDEIDTLCDKPYANTTAKLLNVFINRASIDYEAPQLMNKELNFVRKIFKKAVISGIHADLLHADSKEDVRYWETALKKCKINTPVVEILHKLDEISCAKHETETKTNKTKLFLNKLFAQNPTNK